MKKELTYKNLLDELCKMKFLKFVHCNIYFKNKLIAYYELNSKNNHYELVCINKSFYNYINTNYFWNDNYLIWNCYWNKFNRTGVFNVKF